MIKELFSSEDHSSTLTDVTATKAVEILKDKVSKTLIVLNMDIYFRSSSFSLTITVEYF